jgi:hypothetical protein
MTAEPPPSRRWLGAAIALSAPVVVLRGLSRTEQVNGPMAQWYVQAGVAAALALGYLGVTWLVGRAYRRRTAGAGLEDRDTTG